MGPLYMEEGLLFSFFKFKEFLSGKFLNSQTLSGIVNPQRLFGTFHVAENLKCETLDLEMLRYPHKEI